MKLNYLLVSRILLVALLVGTVGFGSLSRLNQIAEPLNAEIPSSLQQVKMTSSLDSTAQLIRYYDEVLTQSARNYAFTGEIKWALRYRETEHLLSETILKAMAGKQDSEILSEIRSANLELVRMEYMALEFVDMGEPAEAVKVLETEEYLEQKSIYQGGIEKYAALRKESMDGAISYLSHNIEFVIASTTGTVESTSNILLVLIALTLLVVIFLGFYFSRAISRPLAKLTRTVDEVSKGNFDVEIGKTGIVDEINTLADSLNRVMKTMKLAVMESTSRKKK